MGIVRYYLRVLRVAFGHSLSATQDFIFLAVLLVGAVLYVAPHLGMTIDIHNWTHWAAALSGWKIAAVTFGSIVLIRLLCAPYWLSREADESLRKATQRDDIRKQLQTFYQEACELITRRLDPGTSEEEFKKYVGEVDLWRQNVAAWVKSNLGDAALSRLFDSSSFITMFFQGCLNDTHNNVLIKLSGVRKNLASLIESGAWDQPRAVYRA